MRSADTNPPFRFQGLGQFRVAAGPHTIAPFQETTICVGHFWDLLCSAEESIYLTPYTLYIPKIPAASTSLYDSMYSFLSLNSSVHS